jgi:hypothetical protein
MCDQSLEQVKAAYRDACAPRAPGRLNRTSAGPGTLTHDGRRSNPTLLGRWTNVRENADGHTHFISWLDAHHAMMAARAASKVDASKVESSAGGPRPQVSKSKH